MFASTESPGRVLRIAPSGKAFVLLDSPYREIRALRVGGAGTIYAAAVNGKPAPPESAAPAPAAEPPRNVPVASVSTEIMAVTIIDTRRPPPAPRRPSGRSRSRQPRAPSTASTLRAAAM